MKPTSFVWLGDTTGSSVALSQTNPSTEFDVVLNGKYAAPNSLGVTVVAPINMKQSRHVSLTSLLVDNSGVNFTITGTYFGKTISEVLVGPDASSTVYSINTYDVITSIVADDDFTDLSAGLGGGRTNWILWNYNVANNNGTVATSANAYAGVISVNAIPLPFNQLELADKNGNFSPIIASITDDSLLPINTDVEGPTGLQISFLAFFLDNQAWDEVYLTFTQVGLR